jgi:hypothetical protein
MRAKQLTPHSRSVFSGLASAYQCDKVDGRGREILTEALELYPEDRSFNKSMIYILSAEGAATEEMIPYIQAYMRNRPAMDLTGLRIAAWIVKFIAMVTRKKLKFDVDALPEESYKSELEFEEWAEKVLFEYKK